VTELVIGLDIGTSSTKAVAVDAGGTVVAAVSGPHGTDQPRPGWFEQDAQTIWWEQYWTKIVTTVQPRPELAGLYDRRYAVYRDLYAATRPLIPRL
jgi:sugar (pentulose or hexulose) kinase